jgi:hypothetical protein
VTQLENETPPGAGSTDPRHLYVIIGGIARKKSCVPDNTANRGIGFISAKFHDASR